jgi:hypothetical protein
VRPDGLGQLFLSVEGASFRPKNDGIVGGLTWAAARADFTCPPVQTRVLAAVTFTNIVLTDTTNGVITAVPDAARTFFAV